MLFLLCVPSCPRQRNSWTLSRFAMPSYCPWTWRKAALKTIPSSRYEAHSDSHISTMLCPHQEFPFFGIFRKLLPRFCTKVPEKGLEKCKYPLIAFYCKSNRNEHLPCAFGSQRWQDIIVPWLKGSTLSTHNLRDETMLTPLTKLSKLTKSKNVCMALGPDAL